MVKITYCSSLLPSEWCRGCDREMASAFLRLCAMTIVAQTGHWGPDAKVQLCASTAVIAAVAKLPILRRRRSR